MSWSGGYEILNKFKNKLKHIVKDRSTRKEVYKLLISALEDEDWDCGDFDMATKYDSAILEAMKELHPNWFTDEEYDD